MSRQTQRILFLGALIGVAALAGCTANPMLSDRLEENKGAEAFLDRIEKNCGKLSLGSQPVGYLLSENSNDTYFIDESSKLYFGRVDRKTYSADIESFYPGGADQQVLDCIFRQLGE
jgi:hypothetical protein